MLLLSLLWLIIQVEYGPYRGWKRKINRIKVKYNLPAIFEPQPEKKKCGMKKVNPYEFELLYNLITFPFICCIILLVPY